MQPLVFDGCASGTSIKDCELAHYAWVRHERQVNIHTRNVGPQEAFLANGANEKSFIEALLA